MKPIILYAPNTTNFNNNGLGVLDEVITATVTEEKNGIYELQLTYPITGKRFNDIAYSCIIRCLTIPNGSYQTFRIYAISKPINGVIAINAEHISYQLSYIVADAFSATSAAEAMVKIKQKAMTDCPFEFWTDKQTVANYKQEVPENIRARLAGVSGSILDVYGGEYEFDNYTVKLHGQRGANRNVTLRYGKNITDIEQEENISNVYTSIVGYWKGEDDIVKTGVIDCQYASAYPFKRVKSVDFSSEFQTTPSVAQLEAKATSYMSSNSFGVPKVSIKVSFAALWQSEEYKNLAVFERVYLCDTVTIYFEKLGINAQAKVVKTTYNVLLDRYDSIELGEARTNLSGRLASDIGNVDRKLEETKSDLQKAMERAAELITGNKGGHVIFVRDADGKPQEICIMDTEDIQTAQKVWRWNLSGLGYSNTGYTPQAMPLAMTMDGAIVANFITVGELNAQVIKAGILTDKAGYNSWNMQTGEFKLSYNTKVKTSGGSEYGVANTHDVDTAKSDAISTAGTNADNKIDTYDTQTLNQQRVFNKLFKTDSGYNQGVTLTNGNLYLSATYIKSGALEVGGNSGMVGSITLKDASNKTLGTWSNNGVIMYDGTGTADANVTGKWNSLGIDVRKGSIAGAAITLGGGDGKSGSITMKNAAGTGIIGTWNSSGLTVYAGTIEGPSIAGSSIKVGGGNNAGKGGSLYVYNDAGTEIGHWDSGGIFVTAGTIQGPSIIAGGNGNTNGEIHVKGSDNTTDVITMGVNGITVTAGGISGTTISASTITGTNISGGTLTGSTLTLGGGGGNGGSITMNDGSGNSIGTWNSGGLSINSGKITGATIQTGDDNSRRMQMDDSSTLKGMNGGTMYNAINMMQGSTTQMTIDAATQFNIRTESLYVVKGHAGMGSMTVYKTKTTDENGGTTEWGDDSVVGARPCYRLTNVYKEMEGSPTYESSYNVRQIDFPQADGNDVHAMLPVLLRLNFIKERMIHGMIVEEGRTSESRMV